jgi:ubiquinone/menaquinone biosynthesis C-methylase UbiE
MYDWAMARADTHRLGKWRRELLTELTGDVVEIGADTGVNLVHYGNGVQRLVLFEPDRSMRHRAEGRVERSGRPYTEVLEGSAEALRVEAASFDVVVSILVLCSVSDQAVALARSRGFCGRAANSCSLSTSPLPRARRRCGGNNGLTMYGPGSL